MKSAIKYLITFSLIFTSFHAKIWAAKEPLHLEPSSKWHVDFAEDSCTLERQFGEGDQKVDFLLFQFEPGDNFRFTLAGKLTKTTELRRIGHIQFGPNEVQQDFSYFVGKLDKDKHASKTKTPTPINSPSKWLRTQDYPIHLLRKGARGLISFRLMVDETGSTTSCHIQRSTGNSEFDQTVCTGLMKRSQFEPALDKNEDPMPSYWINSEVFDIPR